EFCEEPEGQAAADARHDGRQRAAVEHHGPRRRIDQGEQGFRSAAAAEPPPRLCRGAVHDSSAMGLLRSTPARRRAATGVRAAAAVNPKSQIPNPKSQIQTSKHGPQRLRDTENKMSSESLCLCGLVPVIWILG